MFTRDFETLHTLYDRWDPFTDREVRLIRTRDIYRTSLQFGDPFIFIHKGDEHSGYHKLYRDLEFVHFLLNPEVGDRMDYIAEIRSGFPDAKMLSYPNTQRFLSEYRIITFYRNHVIAANK